MTSMDIFITGLILGGITIFYLLKKSRRFKLRLRMKRAKKGEAAALNFLESLGYTIECVQERKTIETTIDGRAHYHDLRVDYIVSKSGKTYIAEIKTGNIAPNPMLADTRRQLLEYYLAYRPDGILLIDMERKKLHEVVFTISGGSGKKGFLYQILVTGAIGLLCGWFLYKNFGGGF